MRRRTQEFLTAAAMMLCCYVTTAPAQVTIAGLREGSDFNVLPERQPTSSPGEQVEVAEIFAYTCPHCYNLEAELETWRERFPDYVNFVQIPVPFDAWRVLLARAYYTAELLGRLDDMHMAIFREIHETANKLQTREEVREFFGRFGVSAESFDTAFDSNEVNQKTLRARELAISYRVSATPTMVVNGKYTSTPRPGQTFDAWIVAVMALAESERPTVSN